MAAFRPTCCLFKKKLLLLFIVRDALTTSSDSDKRSREQDLLLAREKPCLYIHFYDFLLVKNNKLLLFMQTFLAQSYIDRLIGKRLFAF